MIDPSHAENRFGSCSLGSALKAARSVSWAASSAHSPRSSCLAIVTRAGRYFRASWSKAARSPALAAITIVSSSDCSQLTRLIVVFDFSLFQSQAAKEWIVLFGVRELGGPLHADFLEFRNRRSFWCRVRPPPGSGGWLTPPPGVTRVTPGLKSVTAPPSSEARLRLLGVGLH